MTLFLWHQTAFVTVTMLGSLFGRLPGLQTAPSSLAWVAERLAWIPAFALVLGVLWAAFRRAEHPRRRREDAQAYTRHPEVVSHRRDLTARARR
jgi:hypothetical protein